MRIKYKDEYEENYTIKTIEQYIEKCICNSYLSGGAIEEVKYTTENVSKMFSKLLDLLAAKEILSIEQLMYIAHGYGQPDDIELIED